MSNYLCLNCNVILISVDTLRSDRLGVYGYEKNITPTIDFLSKDGIVFLNAYTLDSWTVPSYATLFTSKDSLLHGLNNWDVSLNDKEITLAEVLKQKGYKTFAFVEDEGVHPLFGFSQGFDKYYYHYPLDYNKLNSIVDENKNNLLFIFLQLDEVNSWGKLFRRGFNLTKISELYKDYLLTYRKDLNLAFLNFILNKTSFNDININSSYSSFKEYFNSLYDESVNREDTIIGTIIELLERKGILKNSIIIITADHGEELDKYYSHIGGNLDVLKIPLIVIYSDKRFKKRFIFEYVSNIDIFPTIIESVGIKNNLLLQGKNFLKNNFIKDYIIAPDYMIYKGFFFTIDTLYQKNELKDLLKKFNEYHQAKNRMFKNKKYIPNEIPYPEDIIIQFIRYNPLYIAEDGFNIKDVKFNISIEGDNNTTENYDLRIKKVETDFPQKEKEANVALLESYFLPTASPYPGMISHLIECPKENTIKEINFYNKSAYIYYLNSRLVPSCINEDLKYKALRFYSYEYNNLIIYEVRSDISIFKLDELVRYFLYIQNTIV